MIDYPNPPRYARVRPMAFTTIPGMWIRWTSITVLGILLLALLAWEIRAALVGSAWWGLAVLPTLVPTVPILAWSGVRLVRLIKMNPVSLESRLLEGVARFGGSVSVNQASLLMDCPPDLSRQILERLRISERAQLHSAGLESGLEIYRFPELAPAAAPKACPYCAKRFKSKKTPERCPRCKRPVDRETARQSA